MTKGRYRAARTAIESGLAGFDKQNVKIKSSFSFYFTIFFAHVSITNETVTQILSTLWVGAVFFCVFFFGSSFCTVFVKLLHA